MKYIDIEKWERKEHFNFFHRMDYPQYNICANIDISNFFDYIRTNKLSFYYAMIHSTTYIANKIINFKYRIREDEIILHDKISPSFTDMNNIDEDDLFKFVTVNMKEDIFEFAEYAEEKSKKQKEYFSFDEQVGRDDLVYITCIPWISFTHISHTITLNKNDSVPRISWGKYFNENDKVLLPFSVQVNHALVDGIHIGKYLFELQKYINNL
ncbi:chloramphenicol acetyltransferase [Iocasia frigidifontis]|uniref:Chloramphenicol acetyltransferase n=1 Tax=Iocasia fonsfrigidae TaxID=2682810 RepID=A0A8A7KAZ2_9FIRM|nr:chloramphenicol acetyltransferase [Iocasia fonsfrigidae]QTL98621.1 chloramphenicol acetyltransferase [Iocasia fonsfrigidae]